MIFLRWLDARDEDGNRRLDDPNDFVRIEIGAALQRDIPVIPILLNGTKIPRADRLPPELQAREFAREKHAAQLRNYTKLPLKMKARPSGLGG